MKKVSKGEKAMNQSFNQSKAIQKEIHTLKVLYKDVCKHTTYP
jgi:hypothetical protein